MTVEQTESIVRSLQQEVAELATLSRASREALDAMRKQLADLHAGRISDALDATTCLAHLAYRLNQVQAVLDKHILLPAMMRRTEGCPKH